MSFVPPPYPYDRLDGLKALCAQHEGGLIDCSIGTPIDPPPAGALEILAEARGARGYPPSIGTDEYRDACSNWMQRRFGIEIPRSQVAACVGTKEFVASLAHYLHLRHPERDTVLFPAISYPTYAMGATLAGLRAVAVRVTADGLDLNSINPGDAQRALLLWSNSPSNPTGGCDNLAAVAAWGRSHNVVVASDECYVEFSWNRPGETILSHGTEGVIAVHSISKRSNLAGIRAGFYAGDPDIVSYLASVRQHAGLMVPAPVQAMVAAAYNDDEHVKVQRDRYRNRLSVLSTALESVGYHAPLPNGGFYLWISKPSLDGWGIAHELAAASGMLVSPGELYGELGFAYARIAVVQSDALIGVAAQRIVQNLA